MNLLVAMFIASFLLVEARQRAVVTLIQEPAFRDRNMELVNPFQREPKRFDRTALKARKTNIQNDAFFLDQFGRFISFFQ